MIVCRFSHRGTLKRSLLCIAGLIILGVLVLRADAGGAAGEGPTLDDRLERLIEQLEKQREEMHVPGMAIAIVKDDEVILSRGFGHADIENEKPATEETLFAIGSTTKAFTAALVAMLAEEGKLDWDDPLRKHLKDFKLHDEEVAEKLTIRDALSHRTGLGRTDLVWISGKATPRDILDAIATAEPRGTFREHFGYNNPMYLFVGMAMGEITGQAWSTLVTDRLLHPLSMNDTTTSVFLAKRSEHLAKGYQWDEENEAFKHMPMRTLDNIAPAGALNSNAREMAQWIRLMLGRGEIDGKRLISGEQIEAMWTGHIEMSPNAEYGLGWVISEWRGRRLIEHGGGIDGFIAQVSLLPEENLGFVLLTNVSPTPLGPASTEFVFNALLGEMNGDDAYPDAGELHKYLGKYRFDPINDDVTVLIKGGKLAVDVPGQMVFTLLPPDEDGWWQFEITDTIKVSFEEDDGEVVAMKLQQAGMTFDMPREGVVREIKPEVELAEVEPYLGRYEWHLGPGEIEILIRNGRLAADVPGQTVYELHLPDEDDRWVFRMTDSIAIRFNRNDETNGEAQVTSLTIIQGGAETVHNKVAGAPESDMPSVDELVERVMAAHGVSSDRPVHRITMRQRIRMAHQGIAGEGTMEAHWPDAFRYHVDLAQFGHITTVIENDGGKVDSTFAPQQNLNEPLLAQARAQHPLMLYQDWRETFDSISVLGLETETGDGGRTIVRATLAKGEFSRIVSVDLETGLIVSERYSERFPQGISVSRTVTYADHRAVGELVLPHRITMEDELIGRTEIEVVEARLHAE